MTIQAAVTNVSKGDGSVKQILWSDLVSGNADGSKFAFVEWAERTIQVSGIWANATCTIQGSNDGITWFVLADREGTALQAGVDFLSEVEENPLYLRPLVTGATATTNLDVLLIARKPNGFR